MTTSDQDPATVIERVHELLALDRADEALELALSAQRLEPADARLTGAVALAASETGDHAAARQWIEWAISLDPGAAWLHDLHATVVTAAQGSPRVAQASAQRAVLMAPTRPSFLFTLVRTSLAARDREGAQAATAALSKAAPDSELRPLAEALLSLDKAKVLRPANRYTPFLAALIVVLTRGFALVPLTIWWVAVAIRRAPHLRRADELIHEALQINPGNPGVRAMAAEVLRLRFRFAQSVDQQVAVAALEHGIIDARHLAVSVTSRVAAMTATGWGAWLVLTALASGTWENDTTVAAASVLLAIGLAYALEATGSAQIRPLPLPLRRGALARPLLPVTLAVVTAVLTLLAVTAIGDEPASTWARAMTGGALTALVTTVIAGRRCLEAQRG